MTKDKVLGVVNILICIFFTFIFATSAYHSVPLVPFNSFILAYAPNLILLMLLILNAILAFRLLFKNELKRSLFIYATLTFSTIFWFFLFFIGSFLSSQPVFHIASLALVSGVYLSIRKKSAKIARLLSLITFLVLLIAVVFGFEEDYCWIQGAKADPTGSKMVIATKEDEKIFKSDGIGKEGSQIGVSWRIHVLCHNTYNFLEAIKDIYLLPK